MFTPLLAKATLGVAVACSGLTGAAHTTDLHKFTPVKVEAKAPIEHHEQWKDHDQFRVDQHKYFNQDEVKNIALKYHQDHWKKPGTVKKVYKEGNTYKIIIVGADHQEHVYQVDAQTGACVAR